LGKFVNIIQNYTAAGLKTIFQQELSTSTTAAWPNYVKWNHHPQRMPLTSDFVSAFNDVAYDILSQKKHNGGIKQHQDGWVLDYLFPSMNIVPLERNCLILGMKS
jgi:hypothetical protein